jgi:hypothetical protein
MSGNLFPLSGTLDPVTGGPAVIGAVIPPWTDARLILTAATVGAITVASNIFPAGTGPGVFKIPGGTTSTSTTALVANLADAAIASLAIRTWEPLTHGPAMTPAEAAASPYFIPAILARGTAVFLDQQQGTVSGSSIASATVTILQTLTAALTLRAPGGWAQTIPAGSTGLVQLAGTPTGPGATWAFANAADCHACDVVIAINS